MLKKTIICLDGKRRRKNLIIEKKRKQNTLTSLEFSGDKIFLTPLCEYFNLEGRLGKPQFCLVAWSLFINAMVDTYIFQYFKIYIFFWLTFELIMEAVQYGPPLYLGRA